MAIKGITDKKDYGFMEVGRIRKGILVETKKRGSKTGEMTSYPKDLDYFRIVPNLEETGLQEQLLKIYGPEPKQLDIYFPFKDIDKFWDPNLECYRGGRMVARSDGEFYEYKIDSNSGEVEVRNWLNDSGKRVPVDMTLNNGKGPEIYRTETKSGSGFRSYYLSPVGRLRLMIRQIPRFVYFTLITGSYRDIRYITDELQSLKILAEYMGKDLVGIPVKIWRRAEICNIIQPGKDPISTAKHFIHLEVEEDWVINMQEHLIGGSGYSDLQIPAAAAAEPVIITEDEEIQEAEFESVAEEIIEELPDPEVQEVEMVLDREITTDDHPKGSKDYTAFYKIANPLMGHEGAKALVAAFDMNAVAAFDEMLKRIDAGGLNG